MIEREGVSHRSEQHYQPHATITNNKEGGMVV